MVIITEDGKPKFEFYKGVYIVMEILTAKQNKSKKPRLNLIWTAILLIAFTCIITMTVFFIQPNDFTAVLAKLIKYPPIFVLNAFPVFLVLVFAYLLCNNVFYAAGLVSLIFNIASLINRYKIILRDDPFVPLDIFLGAEATKIMTDTKLQLDYLLIGIIVLFSAALILAGIFIKFRKINIWLKITGCLLVIIAALLTNTYVYASKTLYDRMPSPNKTFVSGVFNDLGFNYCFLYNLSAYKMDVPDGYSKAKAQKLIEENSKAEKKAPDFKPNVIMVMNEAFSDIALDSVFNYTPETDPMKTFRSIAVEKNTISGHMIVPNFGGGTANTEFDVLTGLQTINLSNVPTSSFRLVRKDTKSIARIFEENSYQSLFIHPGDAWFYNRANVYKFLGIDNQLFVDSFKKPQDYKGAYVSDKAAGAMIIKKFEESQQNNKGPLFNYNVTIQNHMPYTKYKYSGYPLQKVATAKKLSEEGNTLLSNYLEGVKDADNLLKTLTDYFSSRSEPVVLVFFGDHKPSLGASYLAYKELGIDIDETGTIEQVINSRKVPLLIWTNQSAYKGLNFEDTVKKLDLPDDKTFNASYLGAIIMEMLGFQGQDPYYDYLNEARRQVPIITKYNFKTKSQGYTDKLSADEQATVNNIKIWQYYRMNGQKVNSGR